MTRTELSQLIIETSSELESAKYTLDNTPAPVISYSDIEDVSDAYQERLEYNWWVDEQRDLIRSLEKELAGYKEKLANLPSDVEQFGCEDFEWAIYMAQDVLDNPENYGLI